MRGEKVGSRSRPDPAPDDHSSHRKVEKMPRTLEDGQGISNKSNDVTSLDMRIVYCNDTRKHLVVRRDGPEEPGEVPALQTDQMASRTTTGAVVRHHGKEQDGQTVADTRKLVNEENKLREYQKDIPCHKTPA